MLQQAATGGAKACGLRLGELVTGARADWLLLCDEGWLDYCPDDQIINRWMFAGEDSQINSVFVAGHSVVENGYHKLEGVARSEFNRVMKELMN